jgi:hypothetical protein
VPIISFDFRGVSIDLLFARLSEMSVPKDIDILEDKILVSINHLYITPAEEIFSTCDMKQKQCSSGAVKQWRSIVTPKQQQCEAVKAVSKRRKQCSGGTVVEKQWEQ